MVDAALPATAPPADLPDALGGLDALDGELPAGIDLAVAEHIITFVIIVFLRCFAFYFFGSWFFGQGWR